MDLFAENLYISFFSIFCLFTVVLDLRHRRVPNRMLLVAVVLQIIWLVYLTLDGRPASVFEATEWRQAVVGFFVGLAWFYPLWRFRALGAGDVKFIAVLGFLLGPVGLFSVLLVGTVACGLHALGMVVLMGWTSARNVWRSDSATRRGVPYAAYLALAAIAWMVWKVSEGGLRITWGG
jgi:prepilin peptidase CpaA